MSFEEMTNRIMTFRDERDWSQFHNPKDSAISLLLEASELLEHFQWKTREEIDTYLSKNKEEVAEEVADILYWVLLLSKDLEINLPEVFEAKMKKNEAKYPIEKAKGRHNKYTDYE